ncbi:MAG: toprim domain-containing protein, partial [Rhodoplanes sp.]
LGNGVRFGAVRDVLAAGEGIETVLSLRCVLPRLHMVAALSANHLAALMLPACLRRLYIVCDNDDAGRRAAETLAVRAAEMGIETLTLMPTAGDFNDDLRRFGRPGMARSLRAQLAPEDVARFLRR